jgi:hypothetical protein
MTLAFLAAVCSCAIGQVKHTSVPIGDAVGKALASGSLTSEGARPFHIRIEVSEPENRDSPYQGTIEEWWVSPDQWRREVASKDGMKQTIVVAAGKQTERDEGNYFPLWLRSFVTAAFDPVPNAAAWTASGMTIDRITMPNGARSDACARAKSKIGSGDQATDAFSNVCFDDHERLKFFGSPSYSMEFHDYRSFSKKEIARTLVDNPEPGTRLVGVVTVLEDESKAKNASDAFNPLPADEDRFRSAHVTAEQLQKLSEGNPPIVWPTVHSGNVHGHLAVYISVDSQGQVREAWPLNSDNAGLEDSVRDQLRKWKLKPAVDKNGDRLQVEGGMGFLFDTKIADPLPELDEAAARALASKIVEPVWPAGSSSGEVIDLDFGVDEQGNVTGVTFTKGPPSAAAFAASEAVRHWTFHPLMKDGKPQYFHAHVKFMVK